MINDRSHFAGFGALGEAIGKGIYGKRVDLVCDVLGNNEKQSICDEMMKHMILRENVSTVQSFFDVDSSPALPKLANPDPYKCNPIPIEKLGFSKRMFWCRTRMYVEAGDGSYVGMKDGFFCGGSSSRRDYVFAFTSSKNNEDKVIPQAMMSDVDLLKKKGPACLGCMTSSASSSRSRCSHGADGLQ